MLVYQLEITCSCLSNCCLTKVPVVFAIILECVCALFTTLCVNILPSHCRFFFYLFTFNLSSQAVGYCVCIGSSVINLCAFFCSVVNGSTLSLWHCYAVLSVFFRSLFIVNMTMMLSVYV